MWQSHYETVDDAIYHMRRSNAREKPRILLLHGFTGNASEWEHLPELSSHGDLLAIDLLGHGQTSTLTNSARYEMSQAANDLMTLLDRVWGDVPVHLIGYSMGGRLALFLALSYPSRFCSLVLESSSPGLGSVESREMRIAQDIALANRIEREGIDAFVDFWEQISLFDSQKRLRSDVRAAIRDQRIAQNPQGLANSLRGMGTGQQPSLWKKLHTLSIPTLLITGEYDSKFIGIAKQMARAIPRAQHLTVPDTGHNTHVEKPHHFIEIVGSFWESHER